MDSFKDLGFAKLDMTRSSRTGLGETVYCLGKTPEQLLSIMHAFREAGTPALGTKCSPAQAEILKQDGIAVEYDPVSRILKSTWGSIAELHGLVAVCTGGTADIPVAEEAARTAEFFGAKVGRHFGGGLHRVRARIEEIRQADVVIAVAGMEGALGSVLAGLVEAPLVAVPTSVGYGASFRGVAPLLAMLNSCAEGMSVVNIDNGFGAGVLACRMIRMMERRHSERR